MPLAHTELEAREAAVLAPFAQKSRDSRGRRYPESEEDWRTSYQHDRDRIIHSRAFRRLEYKTQVFLNGTGDHLRTRLTHTMEVAAIARNLAQALNLNPDLTEAIALAHDLGHPPFGHKGEDTLNRLMAGTGGFEHNRQSLRIVELLEQKYPDFPGLNLTWEVREGLAKHQTAHDTPQPNLGFNFRSPSLEAQIANLADEITYYSHDLDDGIESGLLSENDLTKNIGIWAQAAAHIRTTRPQAKTEARRYAIIRCIINREVKDVVAATERNLAQTQPRSADDIRRHPAPLAAYSKELARDNLELRIYLCQNLYYHPEVHQPNLRAVHTLEKLFRLYQKSPEKMSTQAQSRTQTEGSQRAICDYLAGMTDRYALAQAAAMGLLPAGDNLAVSPNPSENIDTPQMPSVTFPPLTRTSGKSSQTTKPTIK